MPKALKGASAETTPAMIVAERFLAPQRLLRDLEVPHSIVFEAGARARMLHADREHDVAEARERLAIIPDRSELHRACLTLERAVGRPADPPEVSVAVAWMIDSFPNRGSGVGPGYVDTVEMILRHRQEPFSIAAIAAGLFALVEASRFVPTAAEVLDAVEKARSRFQGALYRTELLVEMAMNAEEVLEAHDAKEEMSDR